MKLSLFSSKRHHLSLAHVRFGRIFSARCTRLFCAALLIFFSSNPCHSDETLSQDKIHEKSANHAQKPCEDCKTALQRASNNTPSSLPLLSQTSSACASCGGQGLFGHQHVTLSNGLQVYILPNTIAPVVHVRLYYKVGCADDPRPQHGLSHFVEHMMFKGTMRVPAHIFDKLLLQYGASYNAFTTQDFTVYETKIIKDQLELVLFLEADRMAHLVLTNEDVVSEREVVHEERAMRLDNNPFGKAWEIFLRALYWKHPYGIPPIGYPENINACSLEAVQKHYDTYYVPNNAILVIAGDTSMEEALPLIKKYFGPLQKGEVPKRQRLKEPSHHHTTMRIDHEAKRGRFVSMTYSYTAPHFKGEHKHLVLPLRVLSYLLSGNALGRFHTFFVEEERIAMDVNVDYEDVSIDPQYFSVTLNLLEHTDPLYAKQRLESEITNLVQKGVSDEEVARAKRDMLAGLVFLKDGVGGISQAFSNIVYDVPIEDLEHWDQKVQSVTTAQVNDALRFIFSLTPAVVFTTYPQKGMQKQANTVQPIHQNFSWWEKIKHTLSNMMANTAEDEKK